MKGHEHSYALGYAGHGVAMAAHLGKTAAEATPDRDAGGAPLRLFPVPRCAPGLSKGNAWYLPLAGLWYRFLDWIE